EMLKRLSLEKKFCPQFHLSLQSGSDKTLKRMNRHYDSAFYMDLVNRIRNTFKNSSITTDVMVGFAGEDETEFLENLEFVKKVGFAKTHVFAYSRRAGTVAHALPCQVPKAEKEKRSREMIKAASLCEQEFLKTQISLETNVLFETAHNNIYSGYTENYTCVKVESDTNLCGKIIKVRLTVANDGYCIGELE
ncbi:MAG: radical SAM protein, partial [Clostridia bacterium]|nr:radical SAM protein [Clostridia bacterium]